jgi:hypothetical protein
MIFRLLRYLGQVLQRRCVGIGVSASLRFDPALELWRFAHVEAVEERAAVGGDGVLQIPSFERCLELAHIARDQVGICPDEFALGKKRFRTERSSQHVKRF